MEWESLRLRPRQRDIAVLWSLHRQQQHLSPNKDSNSTRWRQHLLRQLLPLPSSRNKRSLLAPASLRPVLDPWSSESVPPPQIDVQAPTSALRLPRLRLNSSKPKPIPSLSKLDLLLLSLWFLPSLLPLPRHRLPQKIKPCSTLLLPLLELDERALEYLLPLLLQVPPTPTRRRIGGRKRTARQSRSNTMEVPLLLVDDRLLRERPRPISQKTSARQSHSKKSR